MRLSNGEVLLAWPLASHIITAGWAYNDGSAHNAIDLRAAHGAAHFLSRPNLKQIFRLSLSGAKTSLLCCGVH